MAKENINIPSSSVWLESLENLLIYVYWHFMFFIFKSLHGLFDSSAAPHPHHHHQKFFLLLNFHEIYSPQMRVNVCKKTSF